MLVRKKAWCFTLLFLFASLFFQQVSRAAVIKTITDQNVDGWGGNDTVKVSTSSGSFQISIISDNPSHGTVGYNKFGTVQPQNVVVKNLDGKNGAEIIVLYTDSSGKGRLLVINNSNKYHTSEKIPEQWSYSPEVLSKSIEANYSTANPALVQDLIITQLDGANGEELVGIGRSGGVSFPFVIRYGDTSSTGLTAYSYILGGAAAEEFLMLDLDGWSGYELVGFYDNGGKRSLYVVNNKLEDGYNRNYSKIEKFSFGQGILSQHIRYAAAPSHLTTSDVVITNLDGTNGDELVGLYQPTSTSVSLFRISYSDSSLRVSSQTYTPTSGGIYLGLDRRVNDARYTIGNVNGQNGLDVYGYYGYPTLKGGFVYWDNFSSSNFYSQLSPSSTFQNLTDNGVTIGSLITSQIDQDGDGAYDNQDACPRSHGLYRQRRRWSLRPHRSMRPESHHNRNRRLRLRYHRQRP